MVPVPIDMSCHVSSDLFAGHYWQLGNGRSLKLCERSVIMGVVNVTPDSFSDGGRNLDADAAIATAERLIGEGASIIDIGGQSTRPGASDPGGEEERARVFPVIETLARRMDVLDGSVAISIDTYRAQTARLAIAAGASIVNDVWGFQKQPEIARVVAETGVGAVIMHTGRERERYRDVIADQIVWFEKSLEIAERAGVKRQQIVLDPGFGFAKDVEENIELLACISQLHCFGLPLLIGTSRKRFIGHITARDADKRDIGTAATSVVARLQGAAIFRVHDVAANADALAIADAVIRARILLDGNPSSLAHGEQGVLSQTLPETICDPDKQSDKQKA